MRSFAVLLATALLAAGAEGKPAGEGRAKEQAWLAGRKPAPALAYLLSAGKASLHPLGGSLLTAEAKPETFRLSLTGPVFLMQDGAVFLGGGRLLSEKAGRALSRLIKKKTAFSMEAILMPANRDQKGPARMVSISYDGKVRNFTLGQTGNNWVVRLRTPQTGGNGSKPEVRVEGLAAQRTHVLVTYDGTTERIYLNGKEAQASADHAGGVAKWATDFPLVLGNEAYDARDWSGVIRFVAFYDSVVTAEQAAALAAALPAGDPPLGSGPSPRPEKPEREEKDPLADAPKRGDAIQGLTWP